MEIVPPNGSLLSGNQQVEGLILLPTRFGYDEELEARRLRPPSMSIRSFPSAILGWRDNIEKHQGGLDDVKETATISTMLFGCRRWLAAHGSDQDTDPEITRRLETVEAELTEWLRKRGLPDLGQ